MLTDLLACQGSSGKRLAGVECNKKQQVAETFHNSVSAFTLGDREAQQRGSGHLLQRFTILQHQEIK